MLSSFPTHRPRRVRQGRNIRRLVQESTLSTSDLIMPLFVCEGSNKKEPIKNLPGQNRYSIDQLLKVIKKIVDLDIPAVALFPKIEPQLKSIDGSEAFNDNGLIPKAIQAIKSEFPDLLVISDIALDPYTSHGQDGILDENQKILNDLTNTQLCKQALVHAKAGADIVAPSDMMDGRIGEIRKTLDQHNFQEVCILSYSAKFASAFYGPFRDAVGSASNLGSADKKSYQLNPANKDEALREVQLDIKEGADMVIVKPGMPYLDIVSAVKQKFGVPTFAYQVSGEYSMLHYLSQNTDSSLQDLVMESVYAFKRAGADAILSYYSIEIATWLKGE